MRENNYSMEYFQKKFFIPSYVEDMEERLKTCQRVIRRRIKKQAKKGLYIDPNVILYMMNKLMFEQGELEC